MPRRISYLAIWLLLLSKQYADGEVLTWNVVPQHSPYPPADSSPNAVVVFGNDAWLLSGWNSRQGEWKNRSAVWRSSDNRNWQLVNPAAPYDPYSAFIVFNGAIWAFAEKTYRSVNGVDWELVDAHSPLTQGSRIILFRDELWVSCGRRVLRSADGLTWEIVIRDAPWGERYWPAWYSFKGELWLMGGGCAYGTPEETYYNDIWHSPNGRDWHCEERKAGWSTRYWMTTLFHADRLWLFNGWRPEFKRDSSHNWGNLAEVWWSVDGKSWVCASAPPWSPRHAAYGWSQAGFLYLAGGYGGGDESRLQSDVWRLEMTESIPTMPGN